MKPRPRTYGRARRVLTVGCLTALWLSGGCAPTQFGQAIAYHAEKTSVTDAAARHTSISPYYRFNTALLSDLDDALECDNVRKQRKMTISVLRRANALSQASSANEIERMPARSREQLESLESSHGHSDEPPDLRPPPEQRPFVRAALREPSGIRYTRDKMASSVIKGASEDAAVLTQRFSELADAALEIDLREVRWLPPSDLQRKLRDIREGVEAAPDDKKRSARKALYAWAAPLTAKGIEREESRLAQKCIAKVQKTFDRVAIWRPAEWNGAALIRRYAPIIGVEWPAKRNYDADLDRIGGVKLLAEGRRTKVRIDPTEPTVYSYATLAKIHGRRYRQVNYVWWFPERPKMTPDDPVAGHIDGAMLRITLDNNNEPMFVESSLNCGCIHEVFVSDRIESAAREAFGAPLNGKRFAVEKHLPDKHDLVVIHTFHAGSNAGHPLVLSAAGYHEVDQIRFDTSDSIHGLDIVEDRSYSISDYDELDRLPLGDGIASMFGPDGLVHYAGRPEGVLLAPSGILSAGQPRKRGTQRIRWDDFLHDDPRLLEKTLRIPPLD